jgi:hypothetical protein
VCGKARTPEISIDILSAIWLSFGEIELHDHEIRVEPAPKFASDAEIKLAEQLRYQFKERFLGRSAAPSTLPAHPAEAH